MKLFVTALILFSCISSGYAQISDEEFDSEIDKLLKVRTEDLWQMYEKHNNRRVELEKELFAKKQKNNITSDEEKELSGVYDDMIRISVGIEDIRDLIEDFTEAVRALGE